MFRVFLFFCLLLPCEIVAQNLSFDDAKNTALPTLRLPFQPMQPTQSYARTYFSKPCPKIAFGTHALGGFSEIGLETGFRWYATNADNWNGIVFRSVLFSAGLESNFRFRTDYRIIPKIALEYHGLPITVRLQSRWYPAKNLDFARASWQICPEIGLNLLGMFFITYGHSFAITNQQYVPALGNQFMIGVNFYGWLDEEAF